MANLTLEQANARLALANSLDDIIGILKEIDINSSGSTTPFYSGIKKIRKDLTNALKNSKNNKD